MNDIIEKARALLLAYEGHNPVSFLQRQLGVSWNRAEEIYEGLIRTQRQCGGTMSKLTAMVPPLKLCRKIPEGEFVDTAFVWAEVHKFCEPQIIQRRFVTNNLRTAPAPTLQEIMVELCNFTPYAVKVCQSFNEWHIECCIAQEYGERYISADAVTNPAAAALKLWMELNKK